MNYLKTTFRVFFEQLVKFILKQFWNPFLKTIFKNIAWKLMMLEN